MDGPIPDVSAYMKKSPGRPRGKFTGIGQHQHKKRRLSADGEIDCHGGTRLRQDELLELLHCGGNPDMRRSREGVVIMDGFCADLTHCGGGAKIKKRKIRVLLVKFLKF